VKLPVDGLNEHNTQSVDPTVDELIQVTGRTISQSRLYLLEQVAKSRLTCHFTTQSVN